MNGLPNKIQMPLEFAQNVTVLTGTRIEDYPKLKRTKNRICSIEGCSNKHDSKGYCHVHYNRFKRHGDPLVSKHGSPGTGWVSKGYKFNTEDNKKVREHRQIVEKVLGKPLPKGSVIHHIDENRMNNANNNLVLCPSYGYHRQIHMRMDALRATGHADWRKCPYCHQYDSPENMVHEKVRSVHRLCRNLSKKQSRNKNQLGVQK